MRLRNFMFLLLLSACSNELRVYTDFDRSISIQRLTTYSWLPVRQIESRNNPVFFNELTDKRIKSAVEKKLSEKGYVHSDSSAELIIHYHIVVESKATVRTEPLGYNYGRYWLEKDFDTYRYNQGTLIVDFMDSRNCDLIWRGWVVSILNDENISEELINKAVEEIFRKFPISAAQEITLP